MSKQPQKPLNKSTQTSIKWTRSADDRLLRIEGKLDHIEKRLENLIRRMKAPEKKATGTIIYTIPGKK